MTQEAKSLALIFAIVTTILVNSQGRTFAQEAAQFITTSNVLLTSEFSAATAKHAVRRRTPGVTHNTAKIRTHSHRIGKVGSAGHRSKLGNSGNTHINRGSGEMGHGPGKLVDGPGKTGNGPGKLVDGPGKRGAGPAAIKAKQFFDEGMATSNPSPSSNPSPALPLPVVTPPSPSPPPVTVVISPPPGDVANPPSPEEMVDTVKKKATLMAAYLDCMARATSNSAALQTAIKAAQSALTAAQAGAGQADEQFHFISVKADPCWSANEATSAVSAGRDCAALKAQYSQMRENAIKQKANLSNAQTQLARAQQAFDSLNIQAHAICDKILN